MRLKNVNPAVTTITIHGHTYDAVSGVFDIRDPADADSLLATGSWTTAGEVVEPTGAALGLDDLVDVDIAGAAETNALTLQGGVWKPGAVSNLGGITAGTGISVDATDPLHPIVSATNKEIKFVAADPSGAPAAGSEVQFNTVNFKLWCWTGAAWKSATLA